MASHTSKNSKPCAWMERERLLLASYAMFSRQSVGRRYEEPAHPYRGPFQRDRDRVLHSAAFRRLSGKMQVFTGSMGDYHRTRLTHTHEVTMIARTVGRALRLNEDLIEALALLHDIGHPPYGHSGEAALHACLAEHGGFSHNTFALTLAEELETRYTQYAGLNLTEEVLSGQRFRVTHAGQTPLLEVQVVDLADSMAYNAHDVDDALMLGLLSIRQLDQLALVRRSRQWSATHHVVASPQAVRQLLVHSLIDVQVANLLEHSEDLLSEVSGLDCTAVQQVGTTLGFSPLVADERRELEQFLFDNVYRHPKLVEVRGRAADRLRQLFDRLTDRPQLLPERFQNRVNRYGVERVTGEYLAGLTDKACDALFTQIIELGGSDVPQW
ncbi:MAG: dNTP triphosphohydrolase [Pirellulaceae bacterium]|nr:dNTP triphosphohydrolase [Pirellulaceae bacterium]